MKTQKILKFHQSDRIFSGGEINTSTFKNAYKSLKSGKEKSGKWSDTFESIPKVNPNGVFANHPCSLKYINGYGFDYDHTLANYTKLSGNIIYENAINFLVDNENYPRELCKKEFNSDFAIRGLQFDRLTGNVMKINQFHKLNPRTIYNGHEPVPMSKILEQYGGVRVSAIYYQRYMKELFDLFGNPECCLYSDVIQFLKDKNLDFEPEYVANDILKAINWIHDAGIFHKTVESDPEKYVEKLPNLSGYIKKLKDANKPIFLLTNSSYDYIHNACEYLFEDVINDLNVDHWTKVFNWTILSSKKPSWFNKNYKSATAKFRKLERTKNGGISSSLVPVNSFDDNLGGIYIGGSLQEFHRVTDLRGDRVIYFGDNMNSDLIGPSKTGQWKTCAIIKELETEISIGNNEEFRKSLSYLLDVEHLWFDGQHLTDDIDINDDDKKEITAMLDSLSTERSELRNVIKENYNQQFGSIFRTHATRTLFFHRLARYCDLYTSKVTNMSEYPLTYKFGSRRQFYDHEPVL